MASIFLFLAHSMQQEQTIINDNRGTSCNKREIKKHCQKLEQEILFCFGIKENSKIIFEYKIIFVLIPICATNKYRAQLFTLFVPSRQ